VNQKGKVVHYYFNYAPAAGVIPYPHGNDTELLSNKVTPKDAQVAIEPWGVTVIEEN